MLRHANRISLTATVAVTIMLVSRPGTEARAQTSATPSPADTVVDALKKLPPADQEKAIKEAQGKLGLFHASLFDPILRETVEGFLKNALNEDPNLNPQALLAKAEDRFSQLLKLTDNTASLTGSDKTQIANLVTTLLASATPPAQATPAPPAAQLPAVAPSKSFLQSAAILADLESFLLAKKANLIKAHNNQFGTDPTAQQLLTMLTAAVATQPKKPNDGTFLGKLNELAGQKFTGLGQLTSDDQGAVTALVARAAGVAAPASPVVSPPPGAGVVSPSAGAVAGAGTTPARASRRISSRARSPMSCSPSCSRRRRTSSRPTRTPSGRALTRRPRSSRMPSITRSIPAPRDRGTALSSANSIKSPIRMSRISASFPTRIRPRRRRWSRKSPGSPIRKIPSRRTPGRVRGITGHPAWSSTVETALDDAGQAFVPGFAAFEPLANTLFQDAWSGLGRWRPFQRLHARRYMVLDDDGSLSAPASTSGTRYIVVP